MTAFRLSEPAAHDPLRALVKRGIPEHMDEARRGEQLLSGLRQKAQPGPMRTFALVARVIAGLVSFLYMAVLLPFVDFPPFEWTSTRSLWFIGMWAMSLTWIPLLIVHLLRTRMSERAVFAASVSLALLVGGFFGAVEAASYYHVSL